eukprot:3565284-Prymnesium_polylepis.3
MMSRQRPLCRSPPVPPDDDSSDDSEAQPLSKRQRAARAVPDDEWRVGTPDWVLGGDAPPHAD